MATTHRQVHDLCSSEYRVRKICGSWRTALIPDGTTAPKIKRLTTMRSGSCDSIFTKTILNSTCEKCRDILCVKNLKEGKHLKLIFKLLMQSLHGVMFAH